MAFAGPPVEELSLQASWCTGIQDALRSGGVSIQDAARNGGGANPAQLPRSSRIFKTASSDAWRLARLSISLLQFGRQPAETTPWVEDLITWRWTYDKAVKLRRSDFLPVGEEKEDEALERGYLSVSSDDDQGPGREYVGADDWGEDDDDCDVDVSQPAGNPLESVDFE